MLVEYSHQIHFASSDLDVRPSLEKRIPLFRPPYKPLIKPQVTAPPKIFSLKEPPLRQRLDFVSKSSQLLSAAICSFEDMLQYASQGRPDKLSACFGFGVQLELAENLEPSKFTYFQSEAVLRKINQAFYDYGLFPQFLSNWTDAYPEGLLYLATLNDAGRRPFLQMIVDQQYQDSRIICSGLGCQNLPVDGIRDPVPLSTVSTLVPTGTALSRLLVAFESFTSAKSLNYELSFPSTSAPIPTGTGNPTVGGARRRITTTASSSSSNLDPEIEYGPGFAVYVVLSYFYPSAFKNNTIPASSTPKTTSATVASKTATLTGSWWTAAVKQTPIPGPFEDNPEIVVEGIDEEALREVVEALASPGSDMGRKAAVASAVILATLVMGLMIGV